VVIAIFKRDDSITLNKDFGSDWVKVKKDGSLVANAIDRFSAYQVIFFANKYNEKITDKDFEWV